MKKLILMAACFFACSFAAQAQLVSTLAGSTASGSINGTGSAASFYHPESLCVDPSGNVYVVEQGKHQIRKITPAGVVTTFAGSGTAGFVNGTGTAASFSNPQHMCADASGNIYVADAGNNMIRMITPAGLVSTYAGSGGAGTANGPVASAQFQTPIGIVCDGFGNIYVSEAFNTAISGGPANNDIRKISGGMVSTFAGSGAAGFANGTGTLATFRGPGDLCVDLSGNVYAVDAYNFSVRKITPAGVVSTLAGSGSAGNANGTGTAASFNLPAGISITPSGDIYLAEAYYSMIKKIDPSGVVTTVSGFTSQGFLDGNLQVAQFYNPFDVACFTDSIIYVADTHNNRIRKISCQAVDTPSNTTPVNNASAYAGLSTTLTASGTGDINWYETSTGGAAIATGTACVTSPTLAPGSYTYYADATTPCATSERVAVPFTVYILAGINTIQNNKQGVAVYPNPTTGLFTIESGSGGLKTIEVSDLTGRVLLSSSTSDAKAQLSLVAFSSGVYYVKVQSGKAVNVMRVVKQ